MNIEFIEVLVQDEEESVLATFKARRNALMGSRAAHPEADLDEAKVPSAIADAFKRLRMVASERPHHRVVAICEDVEGTYAARTRVLSDREP